MAESQISGHWQTVYAERAPDEVSWFEARPTLSLELIDEAKLQSDAAIIDVGGGASSLAEHLLDAGFTDVSVADLSGQAMASARAALGDRAHEVSWIEADVLAHDLGRQFDLWHDRAFFHFMVEPGQRRRYLDQLRRHLRPGGHLVIATFGPDGPTQCSGLPTERYGEDALTAMLGAGFELISTRVTDHKTPSGRAQQFLYAHYRRASA